MNSAPLPLPEDPTQLKAEVVKLRGAVSKKEQRIKQLLDYILLLRKRQFGASADRPNKDQLNLFDEAELEQLLAELDEPLDQEHPEQKPKEKDDSERKKPIRRPLPAHLNRIEKIIDLSEEEKAAMGDDWTFMGYDTSEQLVIIPRQHYVIEYKRAKYVPKDDEVAGAEQGVKIASRPEQIIPKAIGHSSVIADVVTRKFVDGLPFYRQEKINAREGIDLSRQTMSSWVIQLHERLTPLMAAMKPMALT